MTKEEISEKRGRAIKSLNDVGAILSLDEMYIDELEKENAELKQDKKDLIFVRNAKADHIIELKDQLNEAKDLIEDMYDKIPASHSDYYKDVMERARQFIKEIEK